MKAAKTGRLPVVIRDEDVELAGDLVLPRQPIGIVLFAHGSGSSRHSPRNQAVAAALHRRDIGTLLFDLLTEAEEEA
ncbi:MAG TPA: phosphoribosyltransferase, partial [Verrucomicrobiae bacterium]|nr:phosphoribosyltransferase [Verrucomicrobiae bacterium]